MRSQTDELALEQSIEKALTGTTAEELSNGISEPTPAYGTKKEFYVGFNRDFNKEYAIDEKRFWHFLESTQEDELDKLKRDPQYKLKVIQRLDRMIKKYGVLKVLRKGL
ncbi:MAG: type I restriction endonuclease subunit R, partial [Campylobacterota bacterium]|nr:type I restriction endonuclease subunit R [Campylobacterota bacterium]